MTQYGQKFQVPHIFGPPEVDLVLVEGHIRMHNILINIRL